MCQLGAGSTQNDSFNSVNLLKECEERNSKFPYNVNFPYQLKLFLNNYDVGKESLILGVTVSTIQKQDEKHWI